MIDKRVAVITGAARGIGAAIAADFAERDYALALLDRDGAALETVVARLEGSGSQAIALVGDLTDLSFAQRSIEEAARHFGRLDVLVNNAAWRELATMREISIESWEQTVRICLTAPAFLSRWAAQHMEQRKQGVIVNITSMMARQAAGIAPACIACKGALESLTYELASLYGRAGIRVVAVSPGAIDTDLSRDVIGDATAGTDTLRDLAEQMIMLGRLAAPEEVARAVAWVASDDASYLTGTVVALDGGWLRNHFPHGQRQQHFPGKFP